MKKYILWISMLFLLGSCETYLRILESNEDCQECQAAAAFYRANEQAILKAMNPVADTVYLPAPCPDCPQPEPCPECIPEQIVIRDTVEIEVPKVCPECPEPDPCPSCPPVQTLHDYYNGLVLYHGFPVSQLSFDYTENHHGNYDGVTVSDSKANFSGNGLITVPHHEELNLGSEITIMADIFLSGNGQEFTSNIICKASNTSGNHTWALGVNPNNRIRFRLMRGTNNSDYFPTTVLQLNTWYRVIAFWQSGSVASVWIKNMQTGQVYREQNTTVLGGSITSLDYDLSIGGSVHSPSGRFFNGQMDRVAVWNRMLATRELNDLIEFEYTWNNFTGNVPSTSQQAYTISSGSILTIEAIPNIGWVFDQWTVNDTLFSQERILQIQMPEMDMEVVANFVKR